MLTSAAEVPNPLVKLSTNGRTPGPRCSAGLHYLQRGPGVLPLAPAYLERYRLSYAKWEIDLKGKGQIRC
jgi:hypothetical protein